MNATLLAVLAGVAWGLGEVFTRAVLRTKEVGPLAAIAVRTTVALPVLWAVWAVARAASPEGAPALLERAQPATVWKLVLGSGLLAGAAGMALFYGALSLGEVSRVKAVAFGVAPAVAAVLGWAALGETLTPVRGIGILCIVTGVVLLST
jgi:probable blue pigment (indigoidine) exporter